MYYNIYDRIAIYYSIQPCFFVSSVKVSYAAAAAPVDSSQSTFESKPQQCGALWVAVLVTRSKADTAYGAQGTSASEPPHAERVSFILINYE